MREARQMDRQLGNQIALMARCEFADAQADAARRNALKLARACYAAQQENARLRAVLLEIAQRASGAHRRSFEPFSQIVLADVAARAAEPFQTPA